MRYTEPESMLSSKNLENVYHLGVETIDDFTGGGGTDIMKAYCHYQEAALHLRHVLELKPNYQPALSALTDMESMPDSTVHIYTVFIIVFLV